MKVILLGNGSKQGVLEAVERLRPEIECRADIVAYDLSGSEDVSRIEADLAIVFGGDGSILRAVNQLGTNQIPVLAVHLGTLSFLSTVQVDELIDILKRPNLFKLPIIKHLLLDCKLYYNKKESDEIKNSTISSSFQERVRPDVSYLVLNEVLVQANTSSRLLGIELHIDGELVTTYRGDGLILSTPVGSTAHNLSAGGPILRKDIDAIVLSPLSPHTLSNRPLVDSPDRCFEIRVQQPAVLILDGNDVATIEPDDAVYITRSLQTFKTIDVPGYSYYGTLRNKLGWNESFTED